MLICTLSCYIYIHGFWRFFAGDVVSSCGRGCTAPFLFGLLQKYCMMYIVSEEGRLAGGSCWCICSSVPHVVFPVEGGIAPSLRMPVLGLELLSESRAGLPADKRAAAGSTGCKGSL